MSPSPRASRQPDTLIPATFGDRLLAHCADLLMANFFSAILLVGWMLLFENSMPVNQQTVRLLGPAIAPWAWWAQLLISFLVVQAFFWTLYQVWYIATQGATPGKATMGIRVVCADGSKAGFMQSLGRFIGQQFSVAFLGLLGHFIFFFRADGRTLYDITSNTIVIRN